MGYGLSALGHTLVMLRSPERPGAVAESREPTAESPQPRAARTVTHSALATFTSNLPSP